MTTEREPLLSDEDLDAIDTSIKAIDDMQEDILRAKSAEIDVGDIEARAAETRRRLIGLKRAFAPNRP